MVALQSINQFTDKISTKLFQKDYFDYVNLNYFNFFTALKIIIKDCPTYEVGLSYRQV